MYLTRTIIIIAAITSVALGHGIVTKPSPRAIGPKSLAACGKSITETIKSDNQSGIEILHQLGATDRDYDPVKCNLRICKGLQFNDNLDNVQTFYPGQEVNLQVWTRIPHKGWASVAIVDTKSLFLVGDPLISFETDSVSGYSAERIAPVDMDFNVTIPEDLGHRCAAPGDCVRTTLTGPYLSRLLILVSFRYFNGLGLEES